MNDLIHTSVGPRPTVAITAYGRATSAGETPVKPDQTERLNWTLDRVTESVLTAVHTEGMKDEKIPIKQLVLSVSTSYSNTLIWREQFSAHFLYLSAAQNAPPAKRHPRTDSEHAECR